MSLNPRKYRALNKEVSVKVFAVDRDDKKIGDALTPPEQENVKMRAPLDVAAARRLLGWSPQWPLEKGIRHYAERFGEYVRK